MKKLKEMFIRVLPKVNARTQRRIVSFIIVTQALMLTLAQLAVLYFINVPPKKLFEFFDIPYSDDADVGSKEGLALDLMRRILSLIAIIGLVFTISNVVRAYMAFIDDGA